MPLEHLEHFLIVAEDIDETVDWYVDVLGLEVGGHPDFGVPVTWLYIGDGDVIHVARAPESERNGGAKRPASTEMIARGGRPIHHVAFRASDLAAMRAHLEARKVPFIEQQASAQDLYQVFLQDPNGITVELNFPAEEAGGAEVPKLALTLAGEV